MQSISFEKVKKGDTILETGIKGTLEKTVTEENLAVNVGSGDVRVFATPMMIAGIEGCAAESVKPYLEPGQTTVGVEISVTHEAATPKGMKVRFETELTEVQGKSLTFTVTVYDEAGIIGRGTHKRVIVTKEKFEQRAEAKAQ
jgi:predicted thioesterase